MRNHGEVLVLNQNYEPLNVCSWKRALTLLYLEKAVVLEGDTRVVHSAAAEFHTPSVVRLAEQIRRPLPEIKLSRQSLMARDEWTCQYCGRRGKHLTVDHVIPRRLGGRHAWENVVACCTECNNRKGDHTPREANLTLARVPQRPRFIPYLSFATFRQALDKPVWRTYLEPFAPHLIQE